MAIANGRRIGVYEVTGRLGVGGMGEVYRARDTTLHRDVALKVLPEAFASEPERLARFEREAHVLASLNHPHIAAAYGLVEVDGTRAIVMELVEGPTLADRIAKGPIPADEALPIARQIAEALETAHHQGIVHRDLKPANIKVRPDGAVKVLDFGLAKALDTATPAGPVDVDNSPTITSPAMTISGVILGTAAYMSPEQAKGKPVDRRADIWAFGCLLYEMLSGRRAFPGEDVPDAIAAVLTRTPDWSLVPAGVPPGLHALLRRCLERDISKRVPDASVVRWMLDEAEAATPPPPSRRWSYAAAVAIGAIALGGLLAAVQRSGPAAVDEPSYHVSIGLGTDATLLSVVNAGGVQRGVGTSAVLSPDGRTVAFVARTGNGPSSLYVRPLDQLAATLVAGTEGAGGPFFSPDGQSIAFFADAKLKRVAVTGGIVATICDVQAGRGGWWGDDGAIVFTPNPQPGASLMRVAATGGSPERLTALAPGEATHRWPQVLPGNAGVLFTVSSSNTGPFDAADLAVVPQSGGSPKVVLKGGAHGRYVPSGHLLFVKAGTLFAAPFDLSRLETTAAPVAVAQDMSYAFDTGAAEYSVSTNGTLLYVPSTPGEGGRGIAWLDRAGSMTALRAGPGDWGGLVFSPNARVLAVDVRSSGGERHVWLYEWERDALTRLTFGGADNSSAVWAPDGQSLAFRSDRASNRVRNIYWQRADGSGQAVALTTGEVPRTPFSWHPSGRFLALQETTQESQDIAILALERSSAEGWSAGEISAFVKTPADELRPVFSLDGRWLAYESDESGGPEIYVRPFPGAGGRWQISTSGGTQARWSQRRRELVYMSTDQRLMVVPYSVDGDVFNAGKPVVWAQREVSHATASSYALHSDGERIAIESAPTTMARTTAVTIVTNFLDELRRLAPTGR